MAIARPILAAFLILGGLSAAHGHDDGALTVDEIVASHVAPLREAIAEERSRIHLRDAAAGIGYIIGIAGVAAYLTRRKEPAA